MRAIRKNGFTIVELIMALALASIVLGLVYQVFVAQRRGYSAQDDVAEMQQNARIASDELARVIKNIGNAIDRDNNQSQLLYCGPYDLIFNSDMDDSAATRPADPSTSISLPNAGGAFAVSEGPFPTSAAETYLLSLKPSTTVSGRQHFDLVKQKFYDSSSDAEFQVAMNLFDEDFSAGGKKPLFSYWGIFDSDGTVKLWGDVDGNGEIDPTTEMPVAALTQSSLDAYRAPKGLSSTTIDNVLHHIEISLSAETPSADLNKLATNLGFRQTVLRSAVTPRNLWFCPQISNITPGLLEIKTSEIYPAGPHNHGSKPTTVAPTTNYPWEFYVESNGKPEANRLVLFELTNAAGDASSTLATASGYTDSNGKVSAEITWADCSVIGALLNTSGTLTYTLKAIIGDDPPLDTELGTCPQNYTTKQFKIKPGEACWLEAHSLSATPIYSCQSPDSFNFLLQAYDVCGVETSDIPAAAVPFDVSGVAQYTFPGGATTENWSSNTDVIQVEKTGAGPFTGVRDADGYFDVSVTQGALPAWLSPCAAANGGITGIPATSKVIPGPPFDFSAPTANIETTIHDDCAPNSVDDVFSIYDCESNTIYDYTEFPGFSLTTTFTDDGAIPGDQGDIPDPVQAAGLGQYQITYTSPVCEPAFPPSGSVSPDYQIDLTGPNSYNSGPINLTLQSCKTCGLTANPTTINACTGSTTISVSACSMNGENIVLEVSNASGGGNGSFNADPMVIQTQTTVALSGNNPSTASADLYVGSASDGDVLEITAYYNDPATGANYWSCGPVQVTVERECQSIEVYSDAGFSQVVGENFGEENCLRRITDLYFTAEDCQQTSGTLSKAIAVYTISQGGVYLDKEEVDLSEYPSATPPFLEFRSVAGLPVEENAAATQGDGKITYPPGETVELFVAYVDPYDPGDDHDPNLTVIAPSSVASTHVCQKDVSLAVPLPVCFPNAITSAGGATWGGNFNVHWGDVVIMGNAEVPNGMIEKLATGMFNGNGFTSTVGMTDRFFDIYVGKESATSTTSGYFLKNAGLASEVNYCTPGSFLPERPFWIPAPGAEQYGNYFCNVPHNKIMDMITFLDYDTMKDLAKDRGVYWFSVDVSGKTYVENAMGAQLPLQEAIHMNGPGILNPWHDGVYMFVDTFDTPSAPLASMTDALINATPTADLPVHEISGGLYTEGIIYIAGSVNFSGSGGTTTIQAETPPRYEEHYDHDEAWFDPTDPNSLPIRSDPTQPPDVFNVNVHINGAFYADGEFQGSGNPAIFGSITTERGYTGSGTPELWYNYNLNVGLGTDDLCINCCKMVLDPDSVQVVQGKTVSIAALDSFGVLSWVSNDTAIATVNSAGTVTGVSPGLTLIKAVDGNNCVARSAVEVIDKCDVFTVAPTISNINAGDFELFTVSNVPSGSSVSWVSSDPSVATIDPVAGIAQGVGPGTAIISATDAPDQCSDPEATLTVSCALSVTPSSDSITTGASTTLTANNASGAVSWTSSDAGTASVDGSGNVSGTGVGSAVITATDGAGCSDASDISVSCGLSLSPANMTLSVGDNQTISPSNEVGGVAWASSNAAVATVDASGKVTAVAQGTATITSTDGAGCTATVSVTVNLAICKIYVTPSSASVDIGATTVLFDHDAWGAVVWNSSDPSVATVNAWGVVTGKSVGSATITATDAAGCVDTSAITVACTLSVAPSSDTINVGATTSLTANNPYGAVSWTSSNSSIVSVNSSGVALGVGSGSATVTATDAAGCSDSSSITTSCALGLTPNSATMTIGGTKTLTATNPAGAVSWSSSDPSVATVNSSGVVTAVNAGSVIITATDAGGCSKTSSITVNAAAVCNLSIYPASPISLQFKSSTTLNAQNANGDVTWTTSNSTAVSISGSNPAPSIIINADQNNKTATITATDSAPTGCSATVQVQTHN